MFVSGTAAVDFVHAWAWSLFVRNATSSKNKSSQVNDRTLRYFLLFDIIVARRNSVICLGQKSIASMAKKSPKRKSPKQ